MIASNHLNLSAVTIMGILFVLITIRRRGSSTD